MDASLNCKLLMPYLKDYVGLFTFYYIRSAVSFFFTPSLTKELDPDWFYQLNSSGREKHTQPVVPTCLSMLKRAAEVGSVPYPKTLQGAGLEAGYVP